MLCSTLGASAPQQCCDASAAPGGRPSCHQAQACLAADTKVACRAAHLQDSECAVALHLHRLPGLPPAGQPAPASSRSRSWARGRRRIGRRVWGWRGARNAVRLRCGERSQRPRSQAAMTSLTLQWAGWQGRGIGAAGVRAAPLCQCSSSRQPAAGGPGRPALVLACYHTLRPEGAPWWAGDAHARACSPHLAVACRHHPAKLGCEDPVQQLIALCSTTGRSVE